MKKLTIFLLSMLLAIATSGQNLLDIYKKGTVKLIPDLTYAQNNDWNKVFKTYLDTIHGKPMGKRKSLKIMPDGSVIINHAYRNYYSKFAPNGTFEKEFGIRNSTGTQFKTINAIEGFINNTFFTGLDNMGNMICFDFNGNYKKTLKLDYMANKMIALPNNKIAVVGWVLWQTQCREFVSLVDFETNKEKIIWDHFEMDKLREMAEKGIRQPFNYIYKFKKGGMMGFGSIPYMEVHSGMSVPPDVDFTGDKLVITIPTTGEINIYDLDGNLIKKDQISWNREYISAQEQREIQQKAIDDHERRLNSIFESRNEEYKDAMEYFVREMKIDLNQIKDPIPLPFVSTIIKDSDGNLLFFQFAQEQNANKFNVWIYDGEGKFVCQSSFVCDDYDLEINPSKMVFREGYIYGLQLAKKSSGVPLRLVRFRLMN